MRLIKQLIKHLCRFFPIWVCLLALLTAAILAGQGNWETARIVGGASILVILCLLVCIPMNSVYGLMGTTGSISYFFVTFLIISAIFTGVYYWGFFRNAGVSYDVNQPHVEFAIFSNDDKDTLTVFINRQMPIVLAGKSDPEAYLIDSSELHYQRVCLLDVISNTVMTSLMQEPTELFSAAATYNRSQDFSNRSEDAESPSDICILGMNKQKAQAFHIVLIIQILISWIFFGVFISLLYSKFRYES